MAIEVLVMMALFAAAAFQSASGLGFGLIAGPILVATMGLSSGLQTAVLLNLLIAMIAWGLGHKDVRYDLLRPTAPGVVFGLVVGLGVSLLIPDWAMKAAMCVALTWIWFAQRSGARQVCGEIFTISAIAGIMGGALAIPGPAVAIYLRRQGLCAQAFRSSMTPLLATIYMTTGIGMHVFNGIDEAAVDAFLVNGPMVVAGLLFGGVAARLAPERILSLLMRMILIGTIAVLVWTTLVDIWIFYATEGLEVGRAT